MKKKIQALLNKEKGFTLVELLAVIVILGIIAAIAVPSIGGIIEKTKDDAKVAEGIQIVSAAKMYASTHKFDFTTAPTLTKTELAGYLDNLKDDSFTVTITQDSTTKKYTYTLTSHNSVTLVDGKDGTTKDTKATEKELLAY